MADHGITVFKDPPPGKRTENDGVFQPLADMDGNDAHRLFVGLEPDLVFFVFRRLGDPF